MANRLEVSYACAVCVWSVHHVCSPDVQILDGTVQWGPCGTVGGWLVDLTAQYSEQANNLLAGNWPDEAASLALGLNDFAIDGA